MRIRGGGVAVGVTVVLCDCQTITNTARVSWHSKHVHEVFALALASTDDISGDPQNRPNRTVKEELQQPT